MIGLIDNDALYKLACCQLLEESQSFLGLTDRQILDQTPFVIRKKIFQKNKSYGHDLPDVRNRVLQACEDSSHIPFDLSDLQLLEQLKDAFDIGEATLLYHAMRTGSAIVISGDKRFYKDLSRNQALMKACSHLEGRLICLEHLMLCLMDSYQYSYVRDRVAPVRACDGSLKLAFSRGKNTEETIAIEALVSFSRETVQALGALSYPVRHWYD